MAAAARTGFVHGLNDILWIGAAVAFASALVCAFLIRQRDFASAHRHAAPQPAAPAEALVPTH